MRRQLRLYLVGGAAVVDMGLREATLDIDYVVDADDPAAIEELEILVPKLKEELAVNLEPASPADFLPIPTGAFDRSPYVRSYGTVSVYYYDLAATVISKLARGAERDLTDVEALVANGRVAWAEVEALWSRMRVSERGWVRHDPRTIERRLADVRARLG